MTNHPNRSKALPVLDDNTRTGMVLGWASTEIGAIRVVRKWIKDHGMDGLEPLAVTEQGGVRLDYDPDIHTKTEVTKANRIGRAWVIKQTAV